MDQHTERLRKLIGHRINFRGHPYRVIEVLDAGETSAQLVLQSDEQEIQADQWGEAHRRVPATQTISPYDSDGQLLAEFEALLGS